jgi:galactan endo-1,6-beta-galactosidase
MNMKYHQPLNPSHPPGAGQGPRAGKCILPALGLAAAWLAALPAAHADYTATPVPTVTWGAWDAWGTSLAWMGKAFGNQPDVADVLFGTNATTFNGTSLPGLGLNFVRYNAGACGAGSVNGRSMVILGIPASKQLPGYWLNPTSTNPGSASWDWSVDANQRAMLLNAQALGANRFELFANSPMWWMLDNFDPAGANSGTSDNLNPADTDDFAIELASIAAYAKTNWGVTFTTVEAFNEPVSSYWSTNGDQEGCHFANGTQPGVIGDLRTELNNRGLSSVVISAPDDNQVDQALSSWDSYDATTQSQVGQINTHGYEDYGTGGNQAGLYNAAHAAGKTLYASEYGDNDTSGLTMAGVISYNFNVMHPTGWTYWQALDTANWGMIAATISNGSIGAVEPKYYVMAQYSRHIRPGMTVIDSGDSNSVAAYDPVAQKLVIVTANHDSPQMITYNLANYATAGGPITTWTTTPATGTYYVSSTGPSLTGGTFSAQFAANSVETFEIQNVSTNANAIANGTYKLINLNSGLALDVFGQGTTNGSRVDQWTYNSGKNQQWTVTSLGGGEYSIEGVQSGRLLDVVGAGTTNGTEVDVWASNGHNNQKWTLTPATAGYYYLNSVNSGRVLDVVGGATTNGAWVDQWSNNGGKNQQWGFQTP